MNEMVEEIIQRFFDPLCAPGRTTTTCELALGVVASLGAAGFVIVPREPTEAMLSAVIPFPEHLRREYPGASWNTQMTAAITAERLAFRARWQVAIEAALGEGR